jgi:hypothetical protein
MKKHKLKLRKEYIEELSEIYPNAFDVVDQNIKIINNNHFIKLMKKSTETQKWIIKNL